VEVERRIVRGDEDRVRRVRSVLLTGPRENGGVRDRALSEQDRCVLAERPEPASDGEDRDGERDDREAKPGGDQVSPWSSLREDQYTMPPITITDKTVTARSTTATATASPCVRPKPSVST